LKGDAIPVEARITAVADVYDAMTSERPYRPALSSDTVLAELREYAGWKYDPRAVAALIGYLEREARAARASGAGVSPVTSPLLPPEGDAAH
jgi:HD-GYP domain-containing protein (c-di-GMP phosphodiesterase class II)